MVLARVRGCDFGLMLFLFYSFSLMFLFLFYFVAIKKIRLIPRELEGKKIVSHKNGGGGGQTSTNPTDTRDE